jgi:hypothetical protein
LVDWLEGSFIRWLVFGVDVERRKTQKKMQKLENDQNQNKKPNSNI